MMSKSKIEWTDETWNVTTGCTRVSSGCHNCYAVAMTKRLAKIEATSEKYSGLVNEGKGHFNGRIKLHEEELEKPLHWRKPRMVFVNSMSDLFHPDVPFEFIDKVFAVMALADKHTFQVLTKRPDRMAQYFDHNPKIDPFTGDEYPAFTTHSRIAREAESIAIKNGEDTSGYWDLWLEEWPLKNVWLGTSVENQKVADVRIQCLLQCPAAVRFLSCEPLLGPVDLSEWLSGYGQSEANKRLKESGQALRFGGKTRTAFMYLTQPLFPPINWIIVGGESGPNARPMHPDWVHSIRDQCNEAGVAFFFKQWGAYSPELQIGEKPDIVTPNGHIKSFGDSNIPGGSDAMWRVGKKKAGRLLFGEEWNQMPEVRS